MQPWLHASVSAGEWVLLSYRLPREPSAPRTTLWRRLKRLGVVQLSDGLVALPADARTREQLEWVAGDVREAVGVAGVWIARPSSLAQERDLATSMSAARAEEYRAVLSQARAAQEQSPAERARAVRRLRAELQRIRRRDFFPPPERDQAVAAVEGLAARDVPVPSSATAGSARP
jgi:hypothetical protein